MPRVNRSKKQREQFVIREFLGVMGYSIRRASWPDRPDAVLTLRTGANTNTVAIEHTEIFNDVNDAAAGKGSAGMRILRFWRKVEDSLKRRKRQRWRRYVGKGMIMAMVDLSPNRIAKHNERQLAEELLDFLEAHLGPKHALFQRRADFDGYPTLKNMVVSLRFDVTDGFDCCHWTCQNISFGTIGTDVAEINRRIEDKNKKAAKYNCGAASEKWLLIAASGSGASNRAGPDGLDANWNDEGLQGSCRNSPFARIFFWERAAQWYKSLKPDEPVVSYSKDRSSGTP